MACPWLCALRSRKQGRCHGVSKNRDRTGFATKTRVILDRVSEFKVAWSLLHPPYFDYIFRMEKSFQAYCLRLCRHEHFVPFNSTTEPVPV